MTEDRSTATTTDPIKKKRRDRFRKFSAIVKLCLLLLIVLGIPAYLFFFDHQFLDQFSSIEDVEAFFAQYRHQSIFVYIGLQILQLVICIIPGQALQFAAGYLFHFWLGLLLTAIGAGIGTVVTYYLAKILGHDAMHMIFGEEKINISPDLLEMIANFANGDARSALSTLEMVVLNGDVEDGVTTVTQETLEQCISKKSLLYDKKGEEHYNLISALHKSMRNSDPDAAVYWLARMLEAGEDPLYVARRVIRFASEDVGMADSKALEVAVAAYQACHFIGMPECSVHLTHAVVYMSLAPKSNALYMAYEHAKKDAVTMLAEPVPLVIRNAPTKLMEELNYGKGYQYAHDTAEKLTNMQCLPDSLVGREYYLPTDQGLEARYAQRLREIKQWKEAHKK